MPAAEHGCYYKCGVEESGACMAPVPLRLALTYLLTSTTYIHTYLPRLLPATPLLVVLLGLAHALAVHLPALWSTQVNRRNSISLLEHIVYLSVLEAAVLMGMQWWRLDASILWATAAYCALNFGWHMSAVLDVLPNSTLSASCLRASLVVYCLVACPLLAQGSTEEALCVGWVAADCVKFVANLVCDNLHTHTV